MRRQYTKAHRNFQFIKIIIFMASKYKVFFQSNSGNLLLLLAFIRREKVLKTICTRISPKLKFLYNMA